MIHEIVHTVYSQTTTKQVDRLHMQTEILQLFKKIELTNAPLFASCCEEIEAAPNHILVHPRQKSKGIYLLCSGIACTIHTKEGMPVVTRFHFAGDFVTSIISICGNTVAENKVQMLTEGKLLFISFEQLEPWRHQLTDLDTLKNRIVALYWAKDLDMQNRFIYLNATAHYQYLIANHPKLIGWVYLKQIASFLRIKEGSLSRIRKQLRDDGLL